MAKPYRYDPMTGEPLYESQPKYDPETGERITYGKPKEEIKTVYVKTERGVGTTILYVIGGFVLLFIILYVIWVLFIMAAYFR